MSRKLSDPVLNDLLLAMQRSGGFSHLHPRSVDRFVRHLDRIDRELEAARVPGLPAPGTQDEPVTVAKSFIDGLHDEIAALKSRMKPGQVAEIVGETVTHPELQRLLEVLTSDEFLEDLPNDAGMGVVDVALHLLRTFKERSHDDSRGAEGATGGDAGDADAASDSGTAGGDGRDPRTGGPASGDAAKRSDAGARGAVAGDRKGSARR